MDTLADRSTLANRSSTSKQLAVVGGGNPTEATSSGTSLLNENSWKFNPNAT